MNPFEIISPDGEDIVWTPVIPTKYKKLLLKGSQVYMARCSFGDMLFNHFAGDGYDIWKSNYLIQRPARVIGRAGVPLLEFSVMYESGFSIDWNGVGAAKLPNKQIEMYHAPCMDNMTSFPGRRQFATVDFHFHKAMLDRYTNDFKVLGRFMEKVHKGEPARLFNREQFTCPRIDHAIREMMAYNFSDALAPIFFDSYTHIVLIALLERLSDFNPDRRRFSPKDIALAQEAHRILSTEIRELVTIDQLSERLLTNPYKLKTAFRYLYNTSIGEFKKTVLMEHAKFLLETTKASLDEIAFQLGYKSHAGFSTAYRRHFEKRPSYERRGPA